VIMQDFGDELVGSCRSLKGFNVTEALADSKDFLINFGGHAQAAGFSLKKENLEKFKEKIQEYATGKLAHLDLKPTLEIDCSLNADDLTFDFLEEVEKMAPFGMGNEKPVFILKDIEPYFVDQVGKNKDHLKFSVKCNDKNLRVIAFNMGHFVNEVRQHRKINLACHLDKNIWKDKTNLQLQAVDISGEEK